MGVGFVTRTIERGFPPVQSDAGPRLPQSQFEILFVCQEIDGAGRAESARTKSIRVSSGDFFHVFATSARRLPSNCLSSGASTEAIITPDAPPESNSRF